MKILERILAIGIVLALIMKFSLTPGGDIIAFWTMLVLACLYYPLGFLFLNQIRLRHIFKKVAYKNVTALRIILAIVTGIGLSTIVVGSLFKLLNYVGADAMLLSGLIVTAVVLVISFKLFLKNNDTNSKFILWRVGIIGVIGIFLILTSELSIVKFQYRNYPDYIEAYTNYLADPRSEELYKKVELERNRIRLSDEEFKKYEESVNDKARD
jgi:hypothetical protein